MTGSEHTPSMPFDRVVLVDGAGQRTLSAEEFFALPLAERIQYVVQQKASFFAANTPVDARQALSQMRRLRARLH
jgi:hypothetical protein